MEKEHKKHRVGQGGLPPHQSWFELWRHTDETPRSFGRRGAISVVKYTETDVGGDWTEGQSNHRSEVAVRTELQCCTVS